MMREASVEQVCLLNWKDHSILSFPCLTEDNCSELSGAVQDVGYPTAPCGVELRRTIGFGPLPPGSLCPGREIMTVNSQQWLTTWGPQATINNLTSALGQGLSLGRFCMEGCYWIQHGSHHCQVNIVWENIAQQYPFLRHHLNNQLAWLGLIQQGASLAGIVLTGWARWDFD